MVAEAAPLLAVGEVEFQHLRTHGGRHLEGAASQRVVGITDADVKPAEAVHDGQVGITHGDGIHAGALQDGQHVACRIGLVAGADLVHRPCDLGCIAQSG